MADTVPDTTAELLAMQEDAVSHQVRCALDLLDGSGLTMADSMELAVFIVRMHRRKHEEEVEQILAEGTANRDDEERLVQWGIDAYKLKAAETLLESVEIPTGETGK